MTIWRVELDTGAVLGPSTGFNFQAAILNPVGLEPPPPPQAVAEPSVAPLLLSGLVSLLVFCRRRVRSD